MYVDSHCHLNFPDLAGDLDAVLERSRANGVTHMLCVAVSLEKFPEVLVLAERHPHVFASVGVHPDHPLDHEPTVEELVALAQHPKVVAIGETGLDYFRSEGDLTWQRTRFRTHIEAARKAGKPLIIHTREAAEDTLNIMAEEGAAEVGGVMHCFTETADVARRAMEMNFLISFSGIVTFKNASQIKEVAQIVPLERMLIETDAPYLAPVPFRGKTNEPAFVKHVADEIARLRGITSAEVGAATTRNFFELFRAAA